MNKINCPRYFAFYSPKMFVMNNVFYSIFCVVVGKNEIKMPIVWAESNACFIFTFLKHLQIYKAAARDSIRGGTL